MKIGAVVVVYNPSLGSVDGLIESLCQQVEHICIIDNSTHPLKLRVQHEQIDYFHFPQNVGIAKAHNLGLAHLAKLNCDYTILFDQDSQIEVGFVECLLHDFELAQTTPYSVAAIGPSIVCSFDGNIVSSRIQKPICSFSGIHIVKQIISSGMLINMRVLPLVGDKEEALFIDGVDHEWCWRAAEQDLVVAISEKTKMLHQLGDSRGRFLGVTYKVGSPIRLYYQFRNILVLLRRDYVPFYWKLRNVSVMPLRFIANAFLQQQRRQRVKYMFKGIQHGLLQRLGPYRSSPKHQHRKN